MRNVILKKRKLVKNRSLRVRKHMQGTALKPRLSVFKSNAHLQAQLIDDTNGTTLDSIATFSKEFRGTEFGKKSKAAGKKLGEAIAKKAMTLGIKEVIFDRGPFKYHGILAELADAARAAGLKF